MMSKLPYKADVEFWSAEAVDGLVVPSHRECVDRELATLLAHVELRVCLWGVPWWGRHI